MREVHIDHTLVNAFSSEILVHFLLRNTLVIEIRVFSDMDPIVFSRDSLQERRTAAAPVSNAVRVQLSSLSYLPPWSSQYHKHLSTLDQAFKIPQNSNFGLLLLSEEPHDQAEQFQRVISKR